MGKPKISIVIPVRNSREELERCLESIRSQEFENYELIVVDGFSTDGTDEVARRLADRLMQSKAPVPACRNLGFSSARGDIFLSIDSDMVLEQGLLGDVAARIPGHGALVIPELGIGRGIVARCKSLEKKCYLGDKQMESARAFTREAFRSAGGYDEALLYGEDRDIHCRIAESSEIGRCGKHIYHDTGGLGLAAALKKAYGYGKSAHGFFAKRHSGRKKLASPARVLFLNRLGVMASEPLTALCLVALKTAEGAAFCTGCAVSALGRRG